MPTNRRRRTVRRRAPAAEWQRAFLETGALGDEHALDKLQLVADYLRGGRDLAALWRPLRDGVLADWRRARPGEEPWAARVFEAPAAAEDLGAPAAKVRERHLGCTGAAAARVDDYARRIVSGELVAGALVRLACQRHLRDRELEAAPGGHPKGFWFSDASAGLVFDFFERVLRLPDAEREHEPGCPLAERAHDPAFLRLGIVDDSLECTCPWPDDADGQPFILLPFQAFILGSLFGWKRANGLRRFRYAYVEVGKGAGKTPMCAGIGLVGLLLDGEKKAEICAAAVTRDQARILWDDAADMVDVSPELKRTVEHAATELTFGRSWFRTVSSEHKGLDGKRPHMGLIDELHEATPTVVNKIRAGAKRRKQALFPEITNSGFDRTSICWQHHEHARRMLEGIIEDDRLFAYVCQMDKGDDPLKDPACWPKANPGLPTLPTIEYLQEQVAAAENIPAQTNMVLRLNFCVWTQASTRFFDAGEWSACNGTVSEEEMLGAPCYAGLDLGQTDDFSAFALVWMLEDGRVAVRMRYWLPSAAVRRFKDRPYAQWQRSGRLEVTDGNATDFDVIQDAVIEDCLNAGAEEFAYDKKFASQLANAVQAAGITAVDQPQGFALNEAIRRLSALVKSAKLCHGGDPILAWMADNAVTREGRYKDIRFDKERSKEKIDGLVALVNALQRALLRVEGESAYADGHGLMVV